MPTKKKKTKRHREAPRIPKNSAPARKSRAAQTPKTEKANWLVTEILSAWGGRGKETRECGLKGPGSFKGQGDPHPQPSGPGAHRGKRKSRGGVGGGGGGGGGGELTGKGTGGKRESGTKRASRRKVG